MSTVSETNKLSEVEINQKLIDYETSGDDNGAIIDSDDDETPPPPTHDEEDESDDDIIPPPPSHDEDDESGDDSEVDSEVDEENEDIVFDDGTETKNTVVESTTQPPITLSEDVEDDDDSDNEQEYNKLELDNYQNSLLDYHQSSISHNSEEISAMIKVIRDEKNNIIDDLHRTVPILSKYERTRVLGQRAKQIENGHNPFVRVADNIIDSYIIAVQELEQKKLPFIIRRPMPSGGSEYWHLRDLELV